MSAAEAEPAEHVAGPHAPQDRVAADHPGINELFALLAYGEVAAFYRLTDEARMAPDLNGWINMASMAAAEMGHYEMLSDTLAARGVDVVPAMSQYIPALEKYHQLTPDLGTPGEGKVQLLSAVMSDSYSYPSAQSVLKVTIAAATK